MSLKKQMMEQNSFQEDNLELTEDNYNQLKLMMESEEDQILAVSILNKINNSFKEISYPTKQYIWNLKRMFNSGSYLYSKKACQIVTKINQKKKF